MSKTYVTGLIIFVPCLILGQISFTAHTITKSADEPYSVYAVDVNGDGYVDVLSASFNDDKVYLEKFISLNQL